MSILLQICLGAANMLLLLLLRLVSGSIKVDYPETISSEPTAPRALAPLRALHSRDTRMMLVPSSTLTAATTKSCLIAMLAAALSM
eukprot:1820666-Pleurochrysis_carterae.AAC.1